MAVHFQGLSDAELEVVVDLMLTSGSTLDLSYLDHPPMVAYIMALFTWMGGDREFAVRIRFGTAGADVRRALQAQDGGRRADLPCGSRRRGRGGRGLLPRAGTDRGLSCFRLRRPFD